MTRRQTAYPGRVAAPPDQDALSVSDGAYLFAVIAALVSGAVTLALRPTPAAAGAGDSDLAEAPAGAAYETAST